MRTIILLITLLVLIAGCSSEPSKPAQSAAITANATPAAAETASEPEDTALQEQRQREEFYNTLKAQYADKQFPGLPGICTTLDECMSMCSTRKEVCLEFCMKNPKSELCLKKHEESSKAPMLPGKCASYEECGKYCQDNPQDVNCAIGRLYEPPTPNLTMPFKMDDYSPVKWGLWTFCVHGGDHPEGHGGIDFELRQGTKIYSSLNGTVAMTEDVAKASPDEGGGLAIRAEKIAVIYYGIVNRQVQKGQNVTVGQYIGDAVRLPAGEHFIHFEVNNFPKEKLECPLSYLDADFRKLLEEMHKRSHYPEKSQEPKLCNCESLPYKPTMTERGVQE